MDWVLTGGLTLRESIILNSGVNWSHNNLVTFSGTTSGHTIDMAGKTFSYIVYFDNPGNSSSGSWTLASNFSVSTSYYTEFRDAGFISNGFSVNFGDYFSASSDVPKVLDFTGTDTVRVQRHWNMLTGVNASLTMGQAVLLLRQPSGLTNTIEFYGGAKTYHDVVIDALNTNTANSILLSHTGTVLRDFYIRLSGPQNLNWQQAFTSRNVSVLYFSNNTFYVPSFQISGNHTMSSLKFSTNFVQPSLYLYNNNTIDTLQLLWYDDLFWRQPDTDFKITDRGWHLLQKDLPVFNKLRYPGHLKRSDRYQHSGSAVHAGYQSSGRSGMDCRRCGK